MLSGYIFPPNELLGKRLFSAVIASKMMFELSPEVMTMHSGSPPAADEVDGINMGLLKSSNEADESTNISSPACVTCSCTMAMRGVHIA